MFLNLIYPQTCGFCGKLNDKGLCKKCEMKLQKNGKFTIENIDDEVYKERAYFLYYGGFVRDIIINYKFEDKPYMYKSFVNFIIKSKKFLDFLKSYDIIIPVPISRKRYKERGYNQSELIAKNIAKQYNKIQSNKKIKIINNCLKKSKNNIQQSKLTKEERIINAKGVYLLENKQKLKNKNILILDDIYTTGSTAFECIQMLKQANPQTIGFLSIAKDL